MRCRTLLLMLMCCALVRVPARAQDKTLTVRAIADAPSFAKRALVVGVGQYEHAGSLAPATTNDARLFARLLQTKFKFPDESITLLTDAPGTPDSQRPTYIHLRNAIKILLAGINDKSEVIIYFSGHGIRAQDHDWLVPMDGLPADVEGTCINYDDLKSRLNTVLPARAMLIVDACRNLADGKDAGSSGFGASKGLAGPQFAEMLSCRPKEESKVGKPADFEESVFTHFLVQGLQGDAEAQDNGVITFDSLNAYVQGRVSQYVSRNYGESQNPDGRASSGKMILVRSPKVLIPSLPGISSAPEPPIPVNPIVTTNPNRLEQPVVPHRPISLLALVPGFIEQAQQTANGISDSYTKDNALANIAETQAKAGDVAGAKQTADGISNGYLKTGALAAVSKAQAKAGDVVGAKQTAEGVSDESLKDSALVAIVEAQTKSKDVTGAKQTAKGIRLNYHKSEALAAIAGAQAENGDVASAMKAAAGTSDNWDKAHIVAAIAEARVRSRDVTGAKQTAKGISYVSTRAATLAYIAEVQARTGSVDGARQTFISAKQTAETISEADVKTWALEAIAEAQAKAGSVIGARQTLLSAKQAAKGIGNSYGRADALADIAGAQAKAGDVAGAKQTAEEIGNSYGKANALAYIAEAQARTGSVDGAYQTFISAKQTAETISDVHDKAKDLTNIAEAQAKAGDAAGAKQTAEEISDASDKAKALSAIAGALYEASSKK